MKRSKCRGHLQMFEKRFSACRLGTSKWQVFTSKTPCHYAYRWNTWTWTSSCRRMEFQPTRLRPAIKATNRHRPLRFASGRPFPLGRYRLLRPQATRRAIIHPVTIQQLDQLLCPGSTIYSHILIPLDAPRPVPHTISNIFPSTLVPTLL